MHKVKTLKMPTVVEEYEQKLAKYLDEQSETGWKCISTCWAPTGAGPSLWITVVLHRPDIPDSVEADDEHKFLDI